MNAKGQRQFFHPDAVTVSADGVHLSLPGTFFADWNKLFGPEPEAVRTMLVELRQKLGWPDAYLAAVLGVPLITLRRWLEGSRQPSAVARKFIWFLHDSLVSATKTAQSGWDLATWGQFDCHMSKEPAPPDGTLGVAPTGRMSMEEFLQQAEAATLAKK